MAHAAAEWIAGLAGRRGSVPRDGGAGEGPRSAHARGSAVHAADVVGTPAYASGAAPAQTWHAAQALRSVQARVPDALPVPRPPSETGVTTEEAAIPSQYLVFSEAGKLVYASGRASDAVFADVGVLHALLAVFAEDRKDALHALCMDDAHGRRTRISVWTRPPLHVALLSARDAPPVLVRRQLARVYDAIVSLVSEARLTQLYRQRPNVDLRGLLLPMQPYIDGVVREGETSLPLALQALPTHPVDAALRAAIAQCVVPTSSTPDVVRPRDVLYVLVLRHGALVCLAHPKRHTPHTDDLALLLTMVQDGAARPDDDDAWAPMCLPHAAPHGFVFVYASRLAPGKESATLVLVTGDRDGFARGRAWRARLQPACETGCIHRLHTMRPLHPVDAMGITGLRHCVVASRRHAQCTSAAMAGASAVDRARIVQLYTHAAAALDVPPRLSADAALEAASEARVPCASACRLQHYRTAHEAVLGWRAASYTLLLTLHPPWLAKGAIASAGNKLAAYVRQNERDLFATATTFA